MSLQHQRDVAVEGSRPLTTDNLPTIVMAVIQTLPNQTSSAPDTPRSGQHREDTEDASIITRRNSSHGDSPEQAGTSGSNPEDFVFNIQEHEVAMTTANSSSYEDWTPRWKSHSTRIDDTIYVPPTAATITSPLMTQNWLALLADHPNKQLTEFFTTGISQGLAHCLLKMAKSG